MTVTLQLSDFVAVVGVPALICWFLGRYWEIRKARRRSEGERTG
jgi:hypothetical protein